MTRKPSASLRWPVSFGRDMCRVEDLAHPAEQVAVPVRPVHPATADSVEPVVMECQEDLQVWALEAAVVTAEQALTETAVMIIPDSDAVDTITTCAESESSQNSVND